MEISAKTFEIFRLQPNGAELYVGEASSYSIALFDVEMLAAKVPGKYAVCDRGTGQRFVLNLRTLDT